MTRNRAILAGAIVVTALAVTLFALSRRETSTIDRVSDWMDDHACASVTRHPGFPAAGKYRAAEHVDLECEHLGGFVRFDRFTSSRALNEALATNNHTLCVLPDATVEVSLFADGATVGSLCEALGGRVRPRTLT